MNLEKFIGDVKLVKATYMPEQHTFLLEIQKHNLASPLGVWLNRDSFPNHPHFSFLDEEVQIYEDVAVVLKEEHELRLNGWVDGKSKKTLINKNSRFFIGNKKQKMLGQIYKGQIGISKNFEPYVFIKSFRFSPSEIKCIVKNNDMKLSGPAKDVVMDGAAGRYLFDSNAKLLKLPTHQFKTGRDLNDLVAFLKKAKLI